MGTGKVTMGAPVKVTVKVEVTVTEKSASVKARAAIVKCNRNKGRMLLHQRSRRRTLWSRWTRVACRGRYEVDRRYVSDNYIENVRSMRALWIREAERWRYVVDQWGHYVSEKRQRTLCSTATYAHRIKETEWDVASIDKKKRRKNPIHMGQRMTFSKGKPIKTNDIMEYELRYEGHRILDYMNLLWSLFMVSKSIQTCKWIYILGVVGIYMGFSYYSSFEQM